MNIRVYAFIVIIFIIILSCLYSTKTKNPACYFTCVILIAIILFGINPMEKFLAEHWSDHVLSVQKTYLYHADTGTFQENSLIFDTSNVHDIWHDLPQSETPRIETVNLGNRFVYVTRNILHDHFIDYDEK